MSILNFNNYLINKNRNLPLSQIDCNPWSDLPNNKSDAIEELYQLNGSIADLQQRFYIDRSKKLLVVLQGMDTSGKNSTIRHVFRGVNPQGVHVASFEKPSTRELSHDYLWRIHKRAPKMGEIMIFDRM